MPDTNLDKEIKDLRAKQRNRNLLVGGLMITGAIAGFLVSRKMKATKIIKVLSTIGGSLILGLPVLLFTNKNYMNRKKEIKDKNDTAIKIVNGKIVIEPKEILPTGDEYGKIQIILSNLIKAKGESISDEEKRNNIVFLQSLSKEELNFWLKLSNAMLDKSLETMSEEEKIKTLKTKYDIDYKEAEKAMDKMMKTLLTGIDTALSGNTK
jgi:hypothetical protein